MADTTYRYYLGHSNGSIRSNDLAYLVDEARRLIQKQDSMILHILDTTLTAIVVIVTDDANGLNIHTLVGMNYDRMKEQV